MHTTYETIFSPRDNYHQFALITTPPRLVGSAEDHPRRSIIRWPSPEMVKSSHIFR
jgi:hypothetical protein